MGTKIKEVWEALHDTEAIVLFFLLCIAILYYLCII